MHAACQCGAARPRTVSDAASAANISWQALSQLQVADLDVEERQVLHVLTQQLVATVDDRHSLKAVEKVRPLSLGRCFFPHLDLVATLSPPLPGRCPSSTRPWRPRATTRWRRTL